MLRGRNMLVLEEKKMQEWNGEVGCSGRCELDSYSHLLGLTLQIRVHDCDVVVAADNIAKRGEALFYALDFDFIWKRVAQVLQFLVCGGCGDEETFAVTRGEIFLAFAFLDKCFPFLTGKKKAVRFELAIADSPDD